MTKDIVAQALQRAQQLGPDLWACNQAVIDNLGAAYVQLTSFPRPLIVFESESTRKSRLLETGEMITDSSPALLHETPQDSEVKALEMANDAVRVLSSMRDG